MKIDITTLFAVVYIALIVIALASVVILPSYFPSLGNYLVPSLSDND